MIVIYHILLISYCILYIDEILISINKPSSVKTLSSY